MQAGA